MWNLLDSIGYFHDGSSEMIHKILRFFRPRRGLARVLRYPDGKRIYKEFHPLRRENMDQDALKVINRLNRYGHRSYLVGGCVRDVLLGKKPKDFDVVTTATPAQIRKLFSNSRSIGRRFKIVHIMFRGGKVIEVSTFRSVPEHRFKSPEKGKDYLIKRDNEFGTPPEDAARRDFTMNALFFDPRNESIIDYVGGFEDLQSKTLCVIGDPDVSFQEDPVRMLRAAKFSALLEMKMDNTCFKAIRKNREQILKANQNRLLEEYAKIFRTGRALDIFASLYDTGLLDALFPEAMEATRKKGKLGESDFRELPVGQRISVADRMLSEREELTINVYLALFLCDMVPDVFLAGPWKREMHLAEYVRSGIHEFCKSAQISGKDRDRLIQIFIAQPRFHRKGRKGKDRPEVFKKKVFFFEAFSVFKIYAISQQDDEAIQKAMFWEIGPRARPPEPNKIVTTFTGRRARKRDFEDRRAPEHADNG
ncbi:MAG TPA: polynucleotide adenylyltransferase PcnB [Leptospiraceae bacterium]|nr:tRNA nucleotidyltransferase [Spirochaetaceae bacterium]HBS06220.1 polynucleotide adenylyltransferase PcnB [Leptospiraceae bacterium]